MQPISISPISPSSSQAGPETRTYVREECVVFSKTNEPFGGLSNMAAGYPLAVLGTQIRTSEALYQACRFPHLPDVQRLIIGEKSPMTAKMRGKPYRSQSRPDWDRVRVKIMRWAIRVKLAQNFDKFSLLLEETGDRPIVEFSKKDEFWGAKPVGINRLTGANVLGRLLMELREEVRAKTPTELKHVLPLKIPEFQLIGRVIGPITDAGPVQGIERDLLVHADQPAPVASEPVPPIYDSPSGRNNEQPASELEFGNKEQGHVITRYPRRLIEVDLPIRRISAHSRREKSIRHGHISTLHIWWARRPLAACRAVICAALWPDPVDVTEKEAEEARKDGRALQPNLCPPAFRAKAKQEMLAWTSHERQILLSEESRARFELVRKKPRFLEDSLELRGALLDFVADFSNWDNSLVPEYLSTARALTQAAHESLGGQPGSRPIIVDSFAGGGSIPLEALRVGADTFASDLNPIPILLNKVVLEYIPKYGQRLADEFAKQGEWIKREAERELSRFYPIDRDGARPIAYLWARTISCEGPGCGAEVPLMRSLWLDKKAGRAVGLQLLPDPKSKRVNFQLIVKQNGVWKDKSNPGATVENPKFVGTVKRSSATCPCCGYTTSAENTRNQFIPRSGGANDARLVAVVIRKANDSTAEFRLGNEEDLKRFKAAAIRLAEKEATRQSPLTLVPDEPLPYLRSIFNINLLGVDTWGKLFNSRQALALVVLIEKTQLAAKNVSEQGDREFAQAVELCLAFAVDRCADYWSSLAVWAGEFVAHTFGRQALGIVWDYAEVSGFSDGSGSYAGAVGWIKRVIERLTMEATSSATVELASACDHPLPNDSANAFITDPPYYDAVPYADLADFFYVWLRRSVGHLYPDLFKSVGTPKDEEIVQLSERNPIYAKKTREYFEEQMKKAMAEGRRVLEPSGIGIVVFAHKTTAGWETQLQAMISAGWIVTASWPIDTERPGRLRANNAAALASSVHLVCRPREDLDGSMRTKIGDWRDVLQELPRRIHEWMPRLAAEGVVGADAIFACLGPALEVFSRYSRVEKASGETVSLKEYLEHVWSAVAKEALAQVFKDADTAGFEPDARITAMWLWTLAGGDLAESSDDKEDTDNEEETPKKKKPTGFVLEYDAARKIAQGLGATLEALSSVVEVKGDVARLLPVSERATALFGKDAGHTPTTTKKRTDRQLNLGLFDELVDEVNGDLAWKEKADSKLGETALDRVHQSMILFAAGRSEAMKRFLVDDGAGQDQRFWKLAQALSALYPSSSDEKRWVDGVLARKKGLGL